MSLSQIIETMKDYTEVEKGFFFKNSFEKIIINIGEFI